MAAVRRRPAARRAPFPSDAAGPALVMHPASADDPVFNPTENVFDLLRTDVGIGEVERQFS